MRTRRRCEIAKVEDMKQFRLQEVGQKGVVLFNSKQRNTSHSIHQEFWLILPWKDWPGPSPLWPSPTENHYLAIQGDKGARKKWVTSKKGSRNNAWKWFVMNEEARKWEKWSSFPTNKIFSMKVMKLMQRVHGQLYPVFWIRRFFSQLHW